LPKKLIPLSKTIYKETKTIDIRPIYRVAIDPDSKIRTTKKREKHTYATNKEKAL